MVVSQGGKVKQKKLKNKQAKKPHSIQAMELKYGEP